ncbi:MAG: hypothetical protein EU532_09200 [Promethearchaeota archaeon]|nr:MAG: hypothetical protein EU532_09200 [Candidatus Lokiarchaeota archaeon]
MSIEIINFIEFDSIKRTFYENIYLNDFKVSIKIPINQNEETNEEIKIEKFDLMKYIFLFG